MSEIARSQDWSDRVQLIHALNFIDRLVMDRKISADEFRYYLEHIRAEERDVTRRAGEAGT